jgi:hypothetical protein
MGLDHLMLIARGIPQIRYLNTFVQEEIAENNLTRIYKYSYRKLSFSYLYHLVNPNFENAKESYFNSIYENERNISTSVKGSFPTDFSTYLSQFTSYYYGDLCSNYYGVMLGDSQKTGRYYIFLFI